jgi:uncharacterized protein YecE (DUF72 family)
MTQLYVGTAGWSIPAATREWFPGPGTQLERYALGMNATEINSSFYRPHRRSTYERWASAVPSNFAFCVKIPKLISHEKRCQDCRGELAQFLDESAGLGEKRRLLLLQFPPSFSFEVDRMRSFFALCRAMGAPHIVCEPRHPSWFTSGVDDLLSAEKVARAAADPACVERAAEPGGWAELRYFRMHGTPRTYYSSYDDDLLTSLAAQARSSATEAWCIFDNTASGAALENALRFNAIAGAARGAVGCNL